MAFKTIVTEAGQTAIADAVASGGTVIFQAAAVGDGGGSATSPQATDTALVNETSARVSINEISSIGNQITVEFIIPASDGGYTVREAAVFDASGAMVMVANLSASEKPAPGMGGGKQLIVRMVATVQDATVINITVDESTVTATKAWVKANAIQTVATLAELQGLTSVDGQLYTVKDYYSDGSLKSGRTFRYKSAGLKSTHNGGTIISPTALASWDGLAGPSHSDMILGTYETDPSGSGVYEMISAHEVKQYCEDFGLHPNNTPAANRVLVKKLLDSGYDAWCKTEDTFVFDSATSGIGGSYQSYCLAVAREGQKVVFEAACTWKQADNNNAVLLYLGAYDNCAFVNLTGNGVLDGNRANQTDHATANDVIRASGCVGTRTYLAKIRNAASAGIKFDDVDDAFHWLPDVENCARNGIFHFGSRNIIYLKRVHDTEDGQFANGVFFTASPDSSSTTEYVDDNVLIGGIITEAGDIGAESGIHCRNTKIINTRIKDSYNQAVIVRDNIKPQIFNVNGQCRTAGNIKSFLTVDSQLLKNSEHDDHSGDGSTTSFAYNFDIGTDADIGVYEDGVLRALTTHYTVTGAGTGSGTVDFVAAPDVGVSVVLSDDRNCVLDAGGGKVGGCTGSNIGASGSGYELEQQGITIDASYAEGQGKTSGTAFNIKASHTTVNNPKSKNIQNHVRFAGNTELINVNVGAGDFQNVTNILRIEQMLRTGNCAKQTGRSSDVPASFSGAGDVDAFILGGLHDYKNPKRTYSNSNKLILSPTGFPINGIATQFAFTALSSGYQAAIYQIKTNTGEAATFTCDSSGTIAFIIESANIGSAGGSKAYRVETSGGNYVLKRYEASQTITRFVVEKLL